MSSRVRATSWAQAVRQPKRGRGRTATGGGGRASTSGGATAARLRRGHSRTRRPSKLNRQ